MSEIVCRYFLRKKEAKLLLDEASRTLRIDADSMFGSKPQVEAIETPRHKVFLVNALPLLAKSEEDLFPTLFFEEFLSHLPKIIVDMGAVQPICGGADVMAPGIVEIQGDFREESLAVVLDAKNRKPIAIVRSLLDSETAKNLKKGKVFKNLAYVGDDIWNLGRTP